MKETVVEQAIKTYFTDQFAQFSISQQHFTQFYTKHGIKESHAFRNAVRSGLCFLFPFIVQSRKHWNLFRELFFNFTSATLCSIITPLTSEQGIYEHKALLHAAPPDCRRCDQGPQQCRHSRCYGHRRRRSDRFPSQLGLYIQKSTTLAKSETREGTRGDDPNDLSVIIIRAVWQAWQASRLK